MILAHHKGYGDSPRRSISFMMVSLFASIKALISGRSSGFIFGIYPGKSRIKGSYALGENEPVTEEPFQHFSALALVDFHCA